MEEGLLPRREVVKRLFQNRGDLVVVSGLGATSWDMASLGNPSLDFPLWGAMGGAAMVGLGLALAQPERTIVVLTGDGEQLMGLGALATIGVQKPKNLRLVVLDNERYGETGQQHTHTAAGVDLAAVALACSFPYASTVRTWAELDTLAEALHRQNDLLLAVVKIGLTPDPLTLPPRDGAYLKHRLREALLGPQAAFE